MKRSASDRRKAVGKPSVIALEQIGADFDETRKKIAVLLVIAKKKRRQSNSQQLRASKVQTRSLRKKR